MRAGHPVVAVVGGVLLLALGGLARPVRAQVDALRDELEIYDVVPPDSSLVIRAGEQRQFSLWVRGEGLQYQWMLDGVPMGQRHAWIFTPQETDIGSHLVTVVVDGPPGRVSRTWEVRVILGGEAPATGTPPESSTSEPAPAPPPSSTSSSTSTTTERPTTTTSTTTTTTREATTSTSRLPTTSSTRAPTTTTTRRRTTTTTRRRTTTTTERVTTTTTGRPTTSLPPVPPTGARATGITDAEVRALFARYEAAWRNHDIEALEAVGQVATQGQADALKSYFESVRDLDVTVSILAITISGDEARVRFIRRDRFRDPTGTPVTKESPVIEKRVVRTPGGLRLSPMR